MKVWRRKKRSLPLDPAPVEQDAAETILSPEEDCQVRQLQDRRSMETRQELDRIRSMGRVDVLKKRLDARLGRNLYRKLNAGPLGKKRKSSSLPISVVRTGSLKGRDVARGDVRGGDNHRRVSSDSGITQSQEEDVCVGFSTTPFRAQQENRRKEQVRELAAIEELGVVRSNTGEDSRVRNHIHNHITRMSNHRLTIKPHRGRGTERKKSSVLVTSMEDTEEAARQLYHQQSKVVIEGFMQAPTHKQRVLDKLSSAQVKRISETLLQSRNRKRRTRNDHAEMRPMDVQSQAPEWKEASGFPPTPSSPPPISPSVTQVSASPPPVSSSSPPIPGSSRSAPPILASAPLVPSSPTTHPSSVAPPHLILATPSALSSSQESTALEFTFGTVTYLSDHDLVESDSSRSIPHVNGGKPPAIGYVASDRYPGVDNQARGSVVSPGGMVNGGYPGDPGGAVGDQAPGSVVSDRHPGGMVNDGYPGGLVGDRYPVLGDRYPVVGDEYSWVVVSDGNGSESGDSIMDESDGDEVEDSQRPLTETRFEDERGIRRKVRFVASELQQLQKGEEMEDTQSGTQLQRAVYDDPEVLLDEVDSSLGVDSRSSLTHVDRPQEASSSASSSAFSSQVSWNSEGSPFVRSKRYTSPQLSLSMSGGDMEAHFIQQSLSHHTAHGHYSNVEVDIDPFAAEFRAGVDALQCNAGAPTTSHAHIQKYSDYLSPHLKGDIPIPAKAFQDQRFLDYVDHLDHEPKVQDYITFQMGIIGDLIEEQYSEKLNQAMDEIFIELVKQQFVSWDTFREVSKRLLMQGSKVQDGIMLIPCFARQLMDYVPQLGTTIGQYTEVVLDRYARDNILGMGGWSSLMESYSQDIVFAEYSQDSPDWQDADTGITSSSPWHGPQNWAPQSPSLAPGSAATLPLRKTTRQASSKSELDPESSLPPQHPLQRSPFPLRRCVSVEVLLGDSTWEQDLPLNPSPAQTVYSRSASINSLNLATPNTPFNLTFALFRSRNQVTDSSLSPVIPSPATRDRSLGTLPEESRLSSRRSSTCSVIILSGHTHIDENGFELVGIGTSESKVRITSYRSTESLTATGEYMDHLYSNRDNGNDSTTPLSERATPPSETKSEQSEGTVRVAGRRRSSVVELLPPMATLTAHLVAMYCLYFSRQ